VARQVVDHDTVPRLEIRPLTAADPVPIAQALAALGWPGKTVDQYRRYRAG